MVTRLEEGRNPQVIIQSPTLNLLFDRYDEIDTVMEMTETGIEVVQTSGNPEVVALLQKHAAEVSDMAERGMEAVHERMMNGH
jgi:predicted urease superfamily metal-dependent hydrolase